MTGEQQALTQLWEAPAGLDGARHSPQFNLFDAVLATGKACGGTYHPKWGVQL